MACPRLCGPPKTSFTEDLLELTQPNEFKILLPNVFRQLSNSLGSPHFQVAERVLYFWTHEYFCSLVTENLDTILPIIFSGFSISGAGIFFKSFLNVTRHV